MTHNVLTMEQTVLTPDISHTDTHTGYGITHTYSSYRHTVTDHRAGRGD